MHKRVSISRLCIGAFPSLRRGTTAMRQSRLTTGIGAFTAIPRPIGCSSSITPSTTAVSVRLISSAAATAEPSKLTADAVKAGDYSLPPGSGLGQHTTDTATMWTARPFIRWIPTGFAESLPRLPTRNIGRLSIQTQERPPPTLSLLALGLPSRNRSVQRQQSEINGDDDAHYECDCGPPYRTADSPLSTPAHPGARSRSCVKPLVARDCPLAYSISQEKA